ncbi:hypothetical protein LYZ37_12820 [Vibrio tubiashii]|uniref:hypothetical protein n=1 Tax=Vibrio tubiashii TaxID=29498 RepID=UPI00234F68BE|nr:hypothetical protein [Vibrio tubiashii]WCP66719.1 hypothetical protein LYZ37_12820 [Vibrio tubiashii]
MRKIIKLQLKKELIKMTYTWLPFPAFVCIFLASYQVGYITLETTVPTMIEWFLSEVLVDMDSINMWFVLSAPLSIVVWFVAKAYKFKRIERSRLRKVYVFIVNQPLNAIRTISGLLFGLWLVQFYPEFGLEGAYERLLSSIYFLGVAVILSIFARYSFDLLVVNKT